MKTIIAGGRNYKFTPEDYAFIDELHAKSPISEVVSGGCPTGADYYGEVWAMRNKVPIKRFPANWKEFGLAAGPIRNRQMAEYGQRVILFPGGHGTISMRNEATKAGLTINEPYA